MVYEYVRKTTQAKWTEETMAIALTKIGEQSITSVSKNYNIPYATLYRHWKSKSSKRKLGRFIPVFTSAQEIELKIYLRHMDTLFFGLTRSDFLKLVFDYAEANQIPHPFTNGKAGEDWLAKFRTRHPDLTLRTPEPTSIARARGPQVTRDDGLPEFVCVDCFQTITKFWSLKTQAKKTESTLMKKKNENMVTVKEEIEIVENPVPGDPISPKEAVETETSSRDEEMIISSKKDKRPTEEVPESILPDTERSVSNGCSEVYIKVEKFDPDDEEEMEGNFTSNSDERPMNLSFEEDRASSVSNSGSYDDASENMNFVDEQLSNIETHISSEGKIHTCDICGRCFKWKSKLSSHMLSHSDEKNYFCSICGNGFKANEERKLHELRHIRNVEASRSNTKDGFRCTICGKVYNNKHSLYSHEITHTNRFFCHTCGKAFRNASELKNHSRSHTNKRPFECEICKKTFTRKSNLNEHIVVHSDDRPFPCRKCGSTFKLKNRRNKHELIHLNEKEVSST